MTANKRSRTLPISRAFAALSAGALPGGIVPVLALLVISGCGQGAAEAQGQANDATQSVATAPGVPLPLGGSFSSLTSVVIDGSGARVLADGRGRTLYTYDPDAQGISNCNGGCAKAWPPVPAPSAALSAPLSAVTRGDQSLQLALDGKPLYTYVGDAQPGQARGDGLGGIWHTLAVPAAAAAAGPTP